ncbi:hypothetical protein DEO72_LG10g1769 [Vigna unguiculata]|uniref:Uncharacterized protein n=2 Tax=Vigna unguiculata TaxID=3917 RepID=A0A4D6NDC9_VIGUN|nr:hypothetical protein DEO72_LG10g1769 [Vigna unguiculata]
MKGDDGLQINGAFLMSLMEEPSASDEGDDERLDSLIRAFEAEISGNNKMEDDDNDNDDSASSTGSELMFERNECGSESWKMEEIDWSNSSGEFGEGWVDMDLVPSSPFEDRSWCVEPCGEEYYAFPNNYLGDHGYNNSLWQDMPCN